MTTAFHPTEAHPPLTPEPQRVRPGGELNAAIRLVNQHLPNRDAAARRLVAAAPANGIDLTMCWVTTDAPGQGQRSPVRQACLAVPGAGRTGMLFISGPPPAGDAGGAASGLEERRRVVEAACEHLAAMTRPDGVKRVSVAQALPEPDEQWAIDALDRAQFVNVGTLLYQRRRLTRADATISPPRLRDPSVSIAAASSIRDESERRAGFIAALDASYEGTLDCPLLCGMRETADVLDSHRATGVWSGDRWWLLSVEGRPAGCLLLAHVPEQDAIELVYLGLAPELRGRGLGRELVHMAIAHGAASGASEMLCAVDSTNTPALRAYMSAGFRTISRRCAMVRPLHATVARAE